MGEELDLAIIGGGPAGLAAGIYAARARQRVLLLEENLTGGAPALTGSIENYPGFPGGISGAELVERMREQAVSFGLEIKTFEPVVSLERHDDGKGLLVKTDSGSYRTWAALLATGMKPAKLGIPGEEELLGRGVSYCATCDGAFFRDREVAVVGGGNSAVEEALFLTRFASRVFIVHRRDRLRADRILQERALSHPKVEILWRRVPVEVKGVGKVSSLVLRNLDDEGLEERPVDGVFFYVGNQPNSQAFRELVELDEAGFVVTDAELRASVEGVYAAGDVRSGSVKQVAAAVGEGVAAQMHAQQYVEKLLGTAYI
jgi:thioredoxin reductase (NADPH)